MKEQKHINNLWVWIFFYKYNKEGHLNISTTITPHFTLLHTVEIHFNNLFFFFSQYFSLTLGGKKSKLLLPRDLGNLVLWLWFVIFYLLYDYFGNIGINDGLLIIKILCLLVLRYFWCTASTARSDGRFGGFSWRCLIKDATKK